MGATILCVDIGGTSTKAGLLHDDGRLTALESIPTGLSADEFFDGLVELIGQTLKAAGDEKPIGIGVAVAGFLDEARTHLAYNPNVAWLERLPLKKRLEDQFALPVELESDSNSACMAEYRFGVNEEPKRFLCLTAGTGLGVGMAIDGEPLRFVHGCMGDAGHIIVDPSGPRCECGGRGCAEAVISAPYLAQQYRLKSRNESCQSLREVVEAARQGDECATSILQEAGRALGIASASLANIFFPDYIAVAGGLSAAADLVIVKAEETFRDMAGGFPSSTVRFTAAHLGPQASLIGAAWPFWSKTARS